MSLSIVVDLVGIAAGLISAFLVRFKSGLITFGVQADRMPLLFEYTGLIVVGAVSMLGVFAYSGLYKVDHLLRFRRTALIVTRGIIVWFLIYLGVSLALKFDPPISRLFASCAAITCFLSVLIMRGGFHWATQRDVIARRLRQRILFVGWNREAEHLSRYTASDPAHPYEIVGCVSNAHSKFAVQPPAEVKDLGNYRELGALFAQYSVDIVIVADLDSSMMEMIALANECEKHFVQFKVIPSYFQILVSGLELETVSGVPVLGVSRLPLDRLSNRLIKRLVDVVGAAVGLLLATPVILLFGAIVYWQSPGPIFYRQVRVGRNGKTFRIIKIRSMKLDAEAGGGAQWAKKDDPRRLPIGAFMREWNIDEVPQFWNVLVGDMSLVGPRPERPELIVDFKEQIPHYNARHASKPGMTGWAQVHGLRGDTDLTKRVQYDLFYLENWSPLLDFQIMAMTLLSRENAY